MDTCTSENASVAVLSGGSSGERDVSLKSGRAVLAGLEQARQRGFGPLQVLDVPIDNDGAWIIDGRSVPPRSALEALEEVDLFFLALHGGAGEDGTMQGFLGALGCAYTGSGVAASALCMDKVWARSLARGAGLRTARGKCIGAVEWSCGRGVWVQGLEQIVAGELIVKPRCGGSSVGVRVTSGVAQLEEAVGAILARGDEALVEERLMGAEVTGGVLSEGELETVALTPVEIRPASGGFFDYREKYDAAGAVELCPPEGVNRTECAAVQRDALVAHSLFGCRSYSRSDFLLVEDGEGVRHPYFLETNTLPGLTERSLLPRAALADNIDFPSLCMRIVRDGLQAGDRRH